MQQKKKVILVPIARESANLNTFEREKKAKPVPRMSTKFGKR